MRHTVAGLLVGLMLPSLTLLHAGAQSGAPQRAAPAEEGARGRQVNRLRLETMPRTPDGRPDLRGFWNAPPLFNSNILEEHPAGFGIDAGRSVVIDPPDGKIPYQPWALAVRDENRKGENAYLDNEGRCYFSGVPRIMLFSFEVQYAANEILLISDYVHTTRIIDMDRRMHIPSAIRLWMGDSIGSWEGDTLVVDTSNFNGKFWFALGGDFATDALHIVERFELSDPGTLQWQATISDPKTFTRPWTWRWNQPYTRGTVEEMGDEACHEGNGGLVHQKNTYDRYRAEIAAGGAARPGRPAVVPAGPGRLTGRWIVSESFDEDGRRNRRPPFHSEIVMNHTSDRIEFQGSTSRQEPIYAAYRLDGSETRVEAPPGITETGRVSVEGEKIVITTRRAFSSPAGDIVAEIREAYSVSGDTLTLERTQVVDGESTSAKAVYRKAR